MLQSFRSWDYYKYQLKAVFRSSFKGRKKKSPNIKSHTYLKYSISLQVSENAPPYKQMQYSNQRPSPRGAALRLLPSRSVMKHVGICIERGGGLSKRRWVTGGKFLYRVNIHCINKSHFSLCYQTKVFPLSNLYRTGWKCVLGQTKNQNPYFQSVIANRSAVTP